jgi:hypothetical protein
LLLLLFQQIEAMPTSIGKKLRSQKVKLACERRQTHYAQSAGGLDSVSLNRINQQYFRDATLDQLDAVAAGGTNKLTTGADTNVDDSHVSFYFNKSRDPSLGDGNRSEQIGLIKTAVNQLKLSESNPINNSSTGFLYKSNQSPLSDTQQQQQLQQQLRQISANYDTVTSVHDIEQDDHIYYGSEQQQQQQQQQQQSQQQQSLAERLKADNLFLSASNKLAKIVEVPSKNITRNNSLTDAVEYGNSKV